MTDLSTSWLSDFILKKVSWLVGSRSRTIDFALSAKPTFSSWNQLIQFISGIWEQLKAIQFWDMKVKKLKGIENKGPGRALLTLPGRPSPPLTTFHNCPRRDGIEKLETGFRLSPMENKCPKLNWMEHFFGFQFLTTSFPYWQVVVLSRFDFTGKPWDEMYIFLVSTNTSLS